MVPVMAPVMAPPRAPGGFPLRPQESPMNTILMLTSLSIRAGRGSNTLPGIFPLSSPSLPKNGMHIVH
eukprot:1158390-Pelagomonas_calceolata.AAC.2